MGRSLIRVMHMSLGMPLISMEQEPHLPALQFQRHARSFACVFWISWIMSSTTTPGDTSALYSTNWPPLASPRQMRKSLSDTTGLQVLDLGVRDLGQLLRHG